MKILYISSACKKENKNKIDKTAKVPQTDTIIKFHNSIINGLKQQKNASIEAIIGLPISIKSNRKIFWKKDIENEENVRYNQVGFINIPILKQLIIRGKIKKETREWINKNGEEKIIIVDASYVSVLPIIIKIAKKNNIRVVGTFADIYDYMYDVKRKSNKLSIIKKIYRQKMSYCYENMQGYIFLTEDMNKLVNLRNKKYIIMEGIIDKTNDESEAVEKYKRKTIMYAGGLKEEYGLINIVEAFEMIKEECDFIICGRGKLEDYITEKSKKNKNIKYLGVIPNNEVINIEKKCTLLVNPRFTNDEYTKYSFPSKIMEYMASGTPVLTTKLAGLPKEYDRYLWYIEDETILGMKEILEKILEKKEDEMNNFGRRAQQFVLNNKNNVIQGKNIIDFLKKLT